MKKLFYLFLPAVLALGACNQAGESDYEAMSADICGCVNKSSSGISDGMKSVMVDAVKNGKDLNSAITEFAMASPEQAMKDGNAMMGLQSSMTDCIKDLEKKYSNVYSTETERQVQEKLVAKLKEKEGCEFSYAIMKMGLDELNKSR